MRFAAKNYGAQPKLAQIDYDELRDKLSAIADWVQQEARSVHQLGRALEYCAVWFDEEGHIRKEEPNEND